MTRVPPAGGSLGAEDRGGTSFVSRAFAAHGEPRRARRSQRDEDFPAPRRAQRHTLILRAPERDLMSSNNARAKGSREVVKRDFVNSSPRGNWGGNRAHLHPRQARRRPRLGAEALLPPPDRSLTAPDPAPSVRLVDSSRGGGPRGPEKYPSNLTWVMPA